MKATALTYQDIFDHSPAEISVIDMAIKNRFKIAFINKTKADEFGIRAEEAIGRPCYEVFEPLRQGQDQRAEFCSGCPSLEAYEKVNLTIHRDWLYIHPKKKQLRICNITASRIPHTDMVIEICRDNTIRRRISELTIELSRVDSYSQIEEILFNGLLKAMYFDRCRFYLLSKDGQELMLKSFKKGIPVVGHPEQRELLDVDLDSLVLTSENSIPDRELLLYGTLQPKLNYISELIDIGQTPKSKYQRAISIHQCHSTIQLEKNQYPVWLDIPISASGKIIGKLSIDIAPDPKNLNGWGIQDYEIDSLNSLATVAGQAWINVRLLDVTELQQIDKIVWGGKGADITNVVNQILTSTCAYLGFKFGHIALDNQNGTVTLIGSESLESRQPRLLPYADSICGHVIMRYHKEKIETPLLFDPLEEENITAFRDIGGHDIGVHRSVKSCLAMPIIDEDGVLIGAWYLESDKNQVFNDYLTDRIQFIAHQISAAIRRVQRDKDLERERDAAVKSKKEAERNLREKEAFYRTAEHEMIAPIEPIATTFKLFKRKIEALNIKDKRLLQLPDEGITHCQFLRYTFDNLDFLRSEPIFLQLEPAQIFKQVIIPVVETLREYGKSQGVHIEYSGYQIVEKYMDMDINRMRNVFFNLLRNAVKYSHRGTCIYVRGVKVTEGTSHMEIENKGIGVPEGWENTIFELYQRADNARKLTTPGSGIGLYISKKIIQAHKGRLYLSRCTDPTIFTLELPKHCGGENANYLDR